MTAHPIFCPTCQTQLAPNAATCPRCGHVLRVPGALNLSDPVHLLGVFVCVVAVVGFLMIGASC